MTPALRQLLPTAWELPKPDRHWYKQPALQQSLEVCRDITREHATSFFFSSFPLSREKKCASYAVYAFCRWVDDRIDEDPNPQDIERSTLSDELDKLLSGESDLPFAAAFREVTVQYSIPRSFYEDLITGVCMDLNPVMLRTYEELEVYCYYVASVVGLIMSRIFGLQTLDGVPRAVEMGVAMQLTNILRDVREDFEKGRIYLPRNEMTDFETGPECIAARRTNDPHWQAFMKFQVDRAREAYRSGEVGLPLLASDGSAFTARLMSRVYGGILGEIERRNYDVLTERVYVPLHRKLWIALKSVAG